MKRPQARACPITAVGPVARPQRRQARAFGLGGGWIYAVLRSRLPGTPQRLDIRHPVPVSPEQRSRCRERREPNREARSPSSCSLLSFKAHVDRALMQRIAHSRVVGLFVLAPCAGARASSDARHVPRRGGGARAHKPSQQALPHAAHSQPARRRRGPAWSKYAGAKDGNLLTPSTLLLRGASF